ncbi:MAG: RIFT barrel domain-containing protein, partial [Kiritimatiellia bacterium]
MKLEARVVFVCLVISAAASVAVEPVAIKVTVSEPAGVARIVQWATGGIPFKPGQVKNLDELTLVRADGQQVPAQFSKLAPYEDGSIQWVLLDFLAHVPAGGQSEHTVRTGKQLTPSVAGKVQEN